MIQKCLRGMLKETLEFLADVEDFLNFFPENFDASQKYLD